MAATVESRNGPVELGTGRNGAEDGRRSVRIDGTPATSFSDSVVIIDPANNENNVAARVQNTERDAFVTAAREAYETLTLAQELEHTGETVAQWKSVFGDNFSIEES